MTGEAAQEADVAQAPQFPIADDGGVPQWVMVARTGRWLGHPTAPEIITPLDLKCAAGYFERHFAAQGTDLVVDYHHASVVAPKDGASAPAAGWISRVELREGGAELWGRVLWTTEAAEAIAARRYRHVSPVLRFCTPDRVTGRPVPMFVHSLALTNTPFLTELASLNEAPATDGAGESPHREEGDGSMTLIEALAQALEEEPEQLASRLGFDGAEADRDVAEAIVAALEAAALEAAAAEAAAAEAAVVETADVSPALANALGLPAGADEAQARVAVLRLKAPDGGMSAVRAQLGLGAAAADLEVVNAIGALQESRARNDAEDLIDAAVAEGRIPPAHRDFYLREAVSDPDAARQVINSLPMLTRAEQARPASRGRALLDGEATVCRQLGLTTEAFLAQAD